MNKLLLSIVILLHIGCKAFQYGDDSLMVYNSRNWQCIVQKLLKEEIPKVCKAKPSELEPCDMQRSYERELFTIIEIDSNLIVIKNLIKSMNLTMKDTYEIIVQEKFSQGFNVWLCSRIMIVPTDQSKSRGMKICRTNIDASFSELKRSKKLIEQLDYESLKYLKESFNFETGSYSGDIIAVTLIDKYYQIKKCHLALYP